MFTCREKSHNHVVYDRYLDIYVYGYIACNWVRRRSGVTFHVFEHYDHDLSFVIQFAHLICVPLTLSSEVRALRHVSLSYRTTRSPARSTQFTALCTQLNDLRFVINLQSILTLRVTVRLSSHVQEKLSNGRTS